MLSIENSPETDPIGLHPAVQLVRHFDNELDDPGLLRLTALEMPSDELGDPVAVPGALQHVDYANHIARWGFDRPEAVHDIVAGARAGRLGRVFSHGATAEFYMHSAVSRNPKFSDNQTILASALRHVVSLAVSDEYRGRLSVRIIEADALDEADSRLAGIRVFTLIERHSRSVSLLRTVFLDDCRSTAGYWSQEFTQAPLWSEALGELALSQADSMRYLLDEASRIEASL